MNREVLTTNMRWTIGAMILTLLTVPGCSDSENIIHPNATTAPKANSVAMSTNDDNDDNDVKVASDHQEVPAAEAFEFPTDVNFFAVPKTTQVSQHRTTRESSNRQESIQLVGFVNRNPSDQEATMALLKVDNRLTCVGVGDSFSEITVISIQDRAVELVRGKDRWTLAMMQQPITNEPVKPIAKAHRTPTNRSTQNTRSGPPVAEELRVPDITLPSMPEPNLDLPTGPGLPPDLDLPDLPTIPDPEAS